MNAVSVTENGFDLAADAGLYSVVAAVAAAKPEQPGLDGSTWADIDARVRTIAAGLIARGVEPGERIAVLGKTSLTWALLDCAALAVGAVIVPVYPTSSAAQIEHILRDSGAAHLAAETAEEGRRLADTGVWTFEEIAGWDDESEKLDARIAAVKADDLAMIVYTSGTTGLAKGVMITHRNMYASSANTVQQTGTVCAGVTALALPLSHVFGQTILFACIIGGAETHLLPSVPDLVPALPKIRPTFLALVPYALEKLRKFARNLLDEGEEADAVARGLELLRTNPVPEPSDHKVAAAFGGRLQYVISGGASLDDSTAGFYAGFGVRILNCYGLTESATAVTVNKPETNRLATVGRPIPGVTVAIAEADGEVLIKGNNVTVGYWGAAADKTPVDAEGWLHSGDIGELDADGFLRITGRKKEILVTSGGKNVAPTPLEDRVRLHPLVSNCMVVGEGRSFVTALVTLDPAQAEKFTGDRTAAVQTAIDDANSLVSQAESIRAFRIVDGDFTVDGGLLTSSMKLRRNAIAEAYSADIDALYSK